MAVSAVAQPNTSAPKSVGGAVAAVAVAGVPLMLLPPAMEYTSSYVRGRDWKFGAALAGMGAAGALASYLVAKPGENYLLVAKPGEDRSAKSLAFAVGGGAVAGAALTSGMYRGSTMHVAGGAVLGAVIGAFTGLAGSSMNSVFNS